MSTDELLTFCLIGVFATLYCVEKAAVKGTSFGRYSWLARGLRHLLFFVTLGVIVFLGTDWRNPFWEHRIGVALILIGVFLFVRTIAHRGEIQAGLESGRLKPGD